MSTFLLRATLASLVFAPVACGGTADPAITAGDAADVGVGSDARSDTDGGTTPVDTGTCPATPPVTGAACAAASGVVCKSAPYCQLCDPRGKWWVQIDDCACRTGKWQCQPTAIDCFGSATFGTYSDSKCTIPYGSSDAGADVHEGGADGDATDDAG